jgi:hypothetical protein
MPQRLQTLKKILTLYQVVEEMQSLEFQRTTVAMHEADEAITVQQRMARSAYLSGRDALSVGDHMGLAISETQQATASWNRRLLGRIRAEREILNDAARKQYIASRLKTEQMKSMTERIVMQEKVVEDHRLQAASDDLFLARRRWKDSAIQF